jgi:thiamine-monophosphate kinase
LRATEPLRPRAQAYASEAQRDLSAHLQQEQSRVLLVLPTLAAYRLQMLLEKRWQPALVTFLCALVLLSWVGANLLAAITSLFLKGRLSPNSTGLIMMVIGVLGFQGVTLAWVHWFLHLHEATWRDAFGFIRRNYGRCIVLALAALPIVLLFVFALSRGSQWFLEYLYSLLHWNWLKPQPQVPVELLQHAWPLHLLIVQAIMTLVIAPVGEEVLFRGILYTAIKQRGRPLAAAGVTSFVFALIHAYPVGFLSLIFLAIVLVIVYERTQNLFAPILLHSLFNAVKLRDNCGAPTVGGRAFQPMNELELIARLAPTLPRNSSVVVATGDDCAVLDLGAPGYVLFKTDAVVEGVHFTGETPPEKVGRKALARCLSDIAAMAGQPNSALVTLALPNNFAPAFVDGVYAGLNALAAEHNVAIVGGETTVNPERALISIAMLGTVSKDKCVLRSGAKPNDAIFVTGKLGGSIHAKHLDFEPRVQEALWLSAHFDVRAMIDLSDGLASDLRHILKASQVGAELLARAIPVSREAVMASRVESSAKPPLLAALTDGEDFELLFTVASKEAVPLVDAWKRRFPHLSLACIGKIISEPGLRIRDKHGARPLNVHGYTHFEKS